jgi:hypothetical protein
MLEALLSLLVCPVHLWCGLRSYPSACLRGCGRWSWFRLLGRRADRLEVHSSIGILLELVEWVLMAGWQLEASKVVRN